MKTVRKICYITGTRADFGLMSNVLSAVSKSKKLSLNIYATGMHLMPKFGYTINDVLSDFPSCQILNATINSDKPHGTVCYLSKLTGLITKAFLKEKPDIALVLGDRAEMLSAATVCSYMGIPIAHIHGGDRTTTVDESVRHAITKLAHIHFVATEDAANRIVKMGEEKWRVHISGAPSIDAIKKIKLPSKNELFSYLNIKDVFNYILITMNPISEEYINSYLYMCNVLEAVKSFDYHAIVVYPNADAGGQEMIRAIEKEKNNPRFRIYPSLPYKFFLALEKWASVWIGNSSAGLIESASFQKAVVNVGQRQQGRICGKNVIHTSYGKNQIINSLHKALTDKYYIKSLRAVKNPWGNGMAGQIIVNTLESISLDAKLLTKQCTY